MIGYRITKVAKTALTVFVLAGIAYGFASGPPAGHTGAPGERTCIECHTGTLNSGPGSVTISGVPETYQPGQEFTITVRVQHPDRRRWGFQITALDDANKPAGTLSPINRNITKVASGTGSLQGRVYIEHTTNGTFAGQAQGASWDVKWTAPDHDVGRVTFYAAGNAANGNNASSGDSIYTTAVATGSTGPMVIAPSYKKGKILMQANGSNVAEGATLEVTGGGTSAAETFPLTLNAAGTKWLVKKSAHSTPSGLSIDDALPAGATVTLVVHNPDGSLSAPASLTR
jgi:Reeler domain-containing protein